jgi:hypothetical protein
VGTLTYLQLTRTIQNDALKALISYLIVAGLTDAQIYEAWSIVARSYNALHEFTGGDEAA